MYPLNISFIASTPPFTIRQILNLAWGLTSNYSHDDKQNKIGEYFKIEFGKIFETYTKGGGSTAPAAAPAAEKQFTESVIMALSKAARNLALARDAHIAYLQNEAYKYISRKEFLDEISSFSSFSAEGLLPKIIAFVGGGSAITTLKDFDQLVRGLRTSEISFINDLIANTTDPGLKADLERRLIEASVPFTLSVNDILIFIVSGIAIMTAVTIIIKLWKNSSLSKQKSKMEANAEKYWKRDVRVNIVDCLFDLYRDMRAIMKQFYPGYTEVSFISSHISKDELDDDNAAKSIIDKEIIHPETTDYRSLIVRVIQEEPKESVTTKS